jgi:hypothetical protein
MTLGGKGLSHAVDLLQIRDWEVAARKRAVWRKEIEEAMVRKKPEAT